VSVAFGEVPECGVVVGGAIAVTPIPVVDRQRFVTDVTNLAISDQFTRYSGFLDE